MKFEDPADVIAVVARRKSLLDYADECRYIAQWQETEDSEAWWLEEALWATAAAVKLEQG